MGDVGEMDAVRPAPDVGRHVLAVGGQPRLARRRLQSLDGNDLGVETIGIGRWVDVAHVIHRRSATQVLGQHPPRDVSIEQRAVRRDTHHRLGLRLAGRQAEPVEDVRLAAADAVDSGPLRE